MINYKIYKHGTDVIAVSSYAGRTVRGVAKLDPRDTFNPEFGVELAVARCDMKVANKRKARAAKKLNEAYAALQAAQQHYVKMQQYYCDSMTAVAEAREALDKLVPTK